MIKFIKGWDEAFLGAESFSDGSEPYYAEDENIGCLIVDKKGVWLYSYDDETQISTEYSQQNELTSSIAKFVVQGIELLNDSQIYDWVRKFKVESEIAEY